MKYFSRFLLLLILLSVQIAARAQDVDAHSPKQNDPITKQQRSAEKKKANQQVKKEKAEEQFRKQNLKLQTKAVRKRMKKNKKKADKWNKN